MERLIKVYKDNPALANSLAVAVIGLVTTALSTPGGVKAGFLAVLALLSGILTRSQVTPVINGEAKVVYPSGSVRPIGSVIPE